MKRLEFTIFYIITDINVTIEFLGSIGNIFKSFIFISLTPIIERVGMVGLKNYLKKIYQVSSNNIKQKDAWIYLFIIVVVNIF